MPKITIRAARVNAGLTQDQMAERLGVSLTTLNAWERGRKSIRPAYLYAICQITGFEPGDIFFPEEVTKTVTKGVNS